MVTVENLIEVAKKRGRPPAFSREVVLDRALNTFWRLGYDGASIPDLTREMGITAQSLYAAFKSKEALYREALTYYQSGIASFVQRTLAADGPTVNAFEAFFNEAAHAFSLPNRPHGCMISIGSLNCAAETQPIAQHVASLRAELLRAFEARLYAGQKHGEFRADADIKALSRFSAAIMQGMAVQARDGASEAELRRIARLALSELARHTITRDVTPSMQKRKLKRNGPRR
jgi:AcrR family transcriptional regulator